LRDLIEHPNSGLLLDFGCADFGGPQQAALVGDWLVRRHVRGPGEFICHLHRDHERPGLYLQQRGTQLIAAHWPGTALANTHRITHGVSDEHQRQVDYIGRAGAAAGFDVRTEVRLNTAVIPDAVIYGSQINIGIEVQRSALSPPAAKARTTKARRAGVHSVWFADGREPSWFWSVASVRMNPELTWSTVPGPRGVTVVSGVRIVVPRRCREIHNSQCPNRRRGCNAWHAVHEPRLGTFVDDVAAMMPAGQMVPMVYRRFNGASYTVIVSAEDKTRYEQIVGRPADLPLPPTRSSHSDPKRSMCYAEPATIGARRAEASPAAAEVPCCARRRPDIAGQTLLLSCALCPDSPSYWRRAVA
jgi:hypothetical protein